MILFIIVYHLLSFAAFGYIYKNEFSLIKSTIRKLKKKFLVFFNLHLKYSSFSFKSFLKFYKPIVSRLFGLKKFRKFVYLSILLNKFKSKFYLIEIFLLKNFSKKKPFVSNSSFKKKKSKLNIFLRKNPVFFKNMFVKNFKSIYKIIYKPSSFVKYDSKDNNNIMFLRKNKIFNKGRYSRNRQLYRTGVYWCIWLSVFLGYSLYFNFYRFTLNFGYNWWIVFFFFFYL